MDSRRFLFTKITTPLSVHYPQADTNTSPKQVSEQLEKITLANQRYLRTRDAADYVGLAPSTMAKMRLYGTGPEFIKAGARVVLYARETLDRWLSDRTFETTDGGKDYRPYFFGQKGNTSPKWHWKAPAEPRPLYNLDKITSNPFKPIMVCEGEKSADAAAVLFPDYVTTTPMNGAKSPDKTEWSVVRGRRIIIAGDNDDAGGKFVKRVARIALEAGAWFVQTVNIEYIGKHKIVSGEVIAGDIECPLKWDLADAVDTGWTADIMKEFVKENRSQKNRRST